MNVIRLPLVILLLCFAIHVQGYNYFSPMSTEDGFCEFANQRAALGDAFNDDEKCELYVCLEGGVRATGCERFNFESDNPKCKLVRGEGSYPSCCPTPICD